MAVYFKIGEKFPKNCGECPLFVGDILGVPAFCVGEGEPTEEEIDAEEDGNLNMYYDGHLSKRPENCPLVKLEEVRKK